MKTKINFILAVLLVSSSAIYAQWGNRVKGNGNITTKTVNVSSYDEVSLVGSMDVTLITGSEGAIQVTTDDNLHELLEIETKGEELVLKMKKNTSYKSKHGIKITVPFQDISEVNVTGSGDMVTKNAISANNFEASVTGSGDLKLNVNATNVEVKITGSGNLTAEGKSNNLEVKVTGSGDFKGSDFSAENVEASVSGSGNASFHVNNQLKARVHGSGDIRYAGNPSIRDTKSTGSGNISSY